MTRGQILEILGDVFVGYRITEEEKSRFSRIYINKKIGTLDLIVFTYNPDGDNPQSVWYFSYYFNKDSHEIMIPSGMERDFCEDFLLLYNDLESVMSKVDEATTKMRELKSFVGDRNKILSKYRDKKLGKLGI